MKIQEILGAKNRGKQYKVVGGVSGAIWVSNFGDLYLTNKCNLAANIGACIGEVFTLQFILDAEFEEVKDSNTVDKLYTIREVLDVRNEGKKYQLKYYTVDGFYPEIYKLVVDCFGAPNLVVVSESDKGRNIEEVMYLQAIVNRKFKEVK